jgi:hypothetical protein
MITFKKWLESDLYQSVFPFMMEEPPVDIDKIKKYKDKESYAKAASKGGKKTEIAAEKIVSARIGSWFVGEEKLLELINNATEIPPVNTTSIKRPPFSIAFAHVKSKEILPNGKSRFRILAFWEGENKLNKQNIENLDPIGGIVYIGGYITDVWVSTAFRGKDSQGFSLYKELRKFANRRGIISVAPNDDLTSKSFRSSQAKHDYEKYKIINNI